MTFQEALEFLGIPEYGERIFHSHSRGELYFLYDYIALAEYAKETGLDVSGFHDWFEHLVKLAEATWERPESVLQHLPKLLKETT